MQVQCCRSSLSFFCLLVHLYIHWVYSGMCVHACSELSKLLYRELALLEGRLGVRYQYYEHTAVRHTGQCQLMNVCLMQECNDLKSKLDNSRNGRNGAGGKESQLKAALCHAPSDVGTQACFASAVFAF